MTNGLRSRLDERPVAGQLVTGENRAVTRSAELAGHSPEGLQRATPTLLEDGSWLLQGEHFSPSAFRSTTIRGCRECLHDDRQRAGLLGMAIRGAWLLEHYLLCSTHGRPLETLWQVGYRWARHDSTARLLELCDDLSDATTFPTRRAPTEFEDWLHQRLNGTGQAGSWLDTMELGAVCEFCLALGQTAMAADHRDPPRNRDPSAAYDLGFSLAREGEAALEAALTALQEARAPGDGVQRVFGAAYDLLSRDPLPEGLRGFHQVMRRHVAATWPLGPGDEILGEPVLERRLHSIADAARLLGRSPEVIRAAVADAGLLEDASARKADEWCVFRAGENVLDRFDTGSSVAKFCEVLSLEADLFEELRDAGLFGAVGRESELTLKTGHALVDRLLLGAEPMGRRGKGWCTVPVAAQRLQVRPAEVVAMILDGRLERIGRHGGAPGFASVLVNLSGVVEDAISAEVFAFSQGLTTAELLSLLRRGGSPATVSQREKGRKDRIMLSGADAAAFHARFISFRSLGVALRLEWDVLEARLEDLGIAPAPDCRRIYLREEVRGLLEEAS
ncbi:hypothetical protein GVY41_12845 [Frigidibacter albus]|uniref:TniQ domain-containing protein n=1 Tax=Frigidibacter albus TaxID=1465486 RepID=A0A6L8VKQ2_9RHOB|nr:TniQ family protein [Frigidibacter albus]MZQ89740.1 hypothetical protein [Frigidibacter albus]NBE31885.1 hypothetical protein [Frigidibacter albus]